MSPTVDRRAFLAGAGAMLAPALVRSDRARPQTPQGVAVGDVGEGRAVVWSRCDRAARMFVEYSTTERFADPRRVEGPAARAGSDFTARTVLTALPPGQRIFYRVRFQDLSDPRAWSEPASGSFTTGSGDSSGRVTIAWSADTVGQGWGINPEWGGLRLYAAMLAARPDVFVNAGDTIYADGPLRPEVALDDGRIWRNLVTPAKSKVAETLDEYRGNYQYNLLDEHMRRFNASASQVVTWDDHEVRDNWYLERSLAGDARYSVKDVRLLASRARQAFLEYNPLPVGRSPSAPLYRTVPFGSAAEIFVVDLRSHRGPNSGNAQPAIDASSSLLGAAQLAWLKGRLASSRAVWKVIASSMPIGLVVKDGPSHFEAIANARPGAPLGRELEIASLLAFIRDRKIRNVVWITGDVHYCAAHEYHPSRAAFDGFDPFWEFVAGPLHAGTFGPNELDGTFGPEVKFTGVPPGMKPNRPPSEGLQFFGTLTIDARRGTLATRLHNLDGATIYDMELEARR